MKTKKVIFLLVATVLLSLGVLACTEVENGTPDTQVVVSSEQKEPLDKNEETEAISDTPLLEPTIQPIVTAGAANTPVLEQTNTPVPSDVPQSTPTDTPKPKATSTPTNTPTPTNTCTPTATNTPTNTPTPTATKKPTNTPTPIKSALSMHFVDVGQGDCTLIVCDGEAMLIDAGDNSKGTAVQLYLSKQKITELKYFVVTHGDSDHCGGADVVLTKFKVGTLLMPEEDKNTATYRDVLDAAKAKSLVVTRPVLGDTYQLGGAVFTIVAPGKQYSDSNNNSIAIYLVHGDNSFLITGDAEVESEADMVNSGMTIDADVYQAGHHGSKTASSGAFLDAVTPDFCVISCGENNTYGHPHAETLNALRTRGIKVYRTDEQGSIVVESDLKELKWNTSPSTSWIAGEAKGSSATPTPTPAAGSAEGGKQTKYILNTSTKKFHFEGCASAKQIADKNRQEYTGSRDALIEKGYSACGKCKP